MSILQESLPLLSFKKCFSFLKPSLNLHDLFFISLMTVEGYLKSIAVFKLLFFAYGFLLLFFCSLFACDTCHGQSLQDKHQEVCLFLCLHKWLQFFNIIHSVVQECRRAVRVCQHVSSPSTEGGLPTVHLSQPCSNAGGQVGPSTLPS